jgi:hypothetical protein
MITRETVRIAALHQLPRPQANIICNAVRNLTAPELALLWAQYNLRPKIDLEYYVKPSQIQNNPGP